MKYLQVYISLTLLFGPQNKKNIRVYFTLRSTSNSVYTITLHNTGKAMEPRRHDGDAPAHW